MNGVINLSVLDGWWGEGYDGTNGWAIKPASERIEQRRRDLEEAHTLYEILQDHMLPLYYAREGLSHSPGWVRMAKRSMTTILPRFNAERMLTEYLTKFYGPAAQRGHAYQVAQCATAREIARWKERVRAAWPSVSIRPLGAQLHRIAFGESVRFETAVNLNGLAAQDVTVELVLENALGGGDSTVQRIALTPDGSPHADGTVRYALDFAPEMCGKLDGRIRAYPCHPLLTHPFELGLMIWA